jgi:hypothetical protein
MRMILIFELILYFDNQYCSSFSCYFAIHEGGAAELKKKTFKEYCFKNDLLLTNRCKHTINIRCFIEKS